jgi:hypothetical protein
MPHLSTPRRKPTALMALPIMLVACAGLTACGSSSSSTSDTAANAAATSTPAPGAAAPGTTTSGGGATGTTPTTPSGAPAPAGAGHFAAVRECLEKNGVTLPARPAGGGAARRGGPGGLLGGAGASGGFKPPKGMSSAKYQEVLKKCGGGDFRPGNFRPGTGGARRAFDSPRFRQALTSFAACLRQNGIDIPTPNTSGKGPIFSTKGIDTASPKFKQAEIKCRPALLAGLRAGSRAGTSAGARGGATTSTTTG